MKQSGRFLKAIVASAGILGILLFAPMPQVLAASASTPPLVQADSYYINFRQPPEVIDGVSMVPLREIAETMAWTVSWDEASQTAVFNQGGKQVKLSVGDKTMTVDNQAKDLREAPVLQDGVMLVPLRALAETLGLQVSWDDKTNTVKLTGSHDKPPALSKHPSWAGSKLVSPTDLKLLARLIWAEAENEPFRGLVAVGAVVLNRVQSAEFPATIHAVIYQAGQFTVVSNGRIKRQPPPQAYQAARAALAGDDPSGGALYFFNPSLVPKTNFLFTLPVTASIGSQRFAREPH